MCDVHKSVEKYCDEEETKTIFKERFNKLKVERNLFNEWEKKLSQFSK
jgi:hypothetical protein